MKMQISNNEFETELNNEQNTEAQKKYVYVFVRQDISIPQQFVQACHAAHSCGLEHNDSGISSSIILFGIDNKEQLESLLEKYRLQLNCHPFYEPYKNTGLTAFATDPIPEDQRHIFKSFSLWKPKFVQNNITEEKTMKIAAQNKKSLIQSMKETYQDKNAKQTILQHGISVWLNFKAFYQFLNSDEIEYKHPIPSWALDYRDYLLPKLKENFEAIKK